MITGSPWQPYHNLHAYFVDEFTVSFLITPMQLKAKMSNLCEYVINIISYVCAERERGQFSQLEWGLFSSTWKYRFFNVDFPVLFSCVCVLFWFSFFIAELREAGK